jgi:hypothetical protein
MNDRRKFLKLGLFGFFLAPFIRPGLGASALPEVAAFRNPGCSCCESWVQHLRQAGFRVSMSDDPDLPARRKKLGMPESLAGCHLATVGSYVVDGHVPAQDIIRLLDDKPDALGLAVPGMPMGSPGMEGGDAEPFAVLIVARDGSTREFSRH